MVSNLILMKVWGFGKVLGALDELLLGKNDGIELRLSKFSSDGNIYGKFESLLLVS